MATTIEHNVHCPGTDVIFKNIFDKNGVCDPKQC
jgi:hypothetical protein